MPRECSKAKWATSAKAQEHLTVGKQSGHYENGHHVYFCPYCGTFHIGRTRYKMSKEERKTR